jgi:predicted nucleic acid-binding protein
VYALSDRSDAWHQRAVSFLDDFRGRMIVPSMVIPESCYLLNAYLGPLAEKAFITSLVKNEVSIEAPTEADLLRSLDLMQQYSDMNIGFVDASVVALSERLKIKEIFTTDRRHFGVIRPKHCKAFSLLP